MYADSASAFGWGYLGLIPKIKDRGNRTPKLPDIVVETANQVIAEHYLNTTKKRRRAAYIILSKVCTDAGIFLPSYQWFCLRIKERSAEELATARDGKRAAYKYQLLNRSRPNPNHGDWPMHVAHIDHTRADLEIVDEDTGKNLGRPWLSLMIDSCTREVLAYDLSFDSPSAATCMTLIRDCVQRNHRLPLVVVTDNGKEFHSTYFESLMARFECTLKRRPPAKARFGCIIERFFGTLNSEFFHSLRGNTQTTKNPRQTTKSIAPRTLAVWPLPSLQQVFEDYVFRIYPSTIHTGLGTTPSEAKAKAIATQGERAGRQIEVNEEFLVLTMPPVLRGTAKVQPVRIWSFQ
jgi:putative transposase